MGMRIIDRLTTNQDPNQPAGRNLDNVRRNLHQKVIDRLDVAAIANDLAARSAGSARLRR